jgi:hypothetical protein
MATYVLAFVGIEVTKGSFSEVAQVVEALARECGVHYQSDQDGATFQMEGRNLIDYAVLDRLRDFMASKGLKFTIHADEFLATECGYYFSNGDDTCDAGDGHNASDAEASAKQEAV